MTKLAIKGGQPYKTKQFPNWPMSGQRELKLVQEVVTSGKWWRMSGSKVEEFERKFAEHHNIKYCLGVTNGTHAIELALSALGIGKGDEVIIPAFTFISTATAPIYCDAIPVAVDVDPNTFCMMSEAFEKAITEKTKAVIPVHMAGQMCDMEAISDIARKHNIKIIEDAAHAHGAEWNHKKPGELSDIATFSFQNGKIMTCGEGGAVVTNNKELYDKMFLIHGVGRPKNDRVYAHLELGSNYRMNEFQAAILIAQLERLNELNGVRKINSELLDKLLKDIPGIKSQTENSKITLNTHYMYMFYYNSEYFGGMNRQEFVDSLIEEGIPAFIAYPVVSNTEFFRNNNFRGHIQNESNYRNFNLTNAKKIEDEVIWLPHYTLLGDEQDIQEIAGAIKKIQDAVK